MTTAIGIMKRTIGKFMLLDQDQIDELAKELYLTECAVMDIEPDLGRGGFKTQIGVWRALAVRAMNYFIEHDSNLLDRFLERKN